MPVFGGKKRCKEIERDNLALREDNVLLKEEVRQLQVRNAQLEQALAAAKKHSGNSSKPPYSDIVKPDPNRRGKNKQKRRIRGQKGHPKHERPVFTPDQVHHRVPYLITRCPVDPSHQIVPVQDRHRTIQQVELVKDPFVVTEHTAYSVWCRDCGCHHQAPLPVEIVRAGLFGPRLTALTTYLKGRLHGSYSGIRDFLRDVVGVTVSRGYVAKLLRKASQAFARPHEQLIELLPHQSQLNCDETGHKENGRRYSIWCFRALGFVVFKIDRSRGAEVLLRILGEGFQGILGCDYYAAYVKYARQCSVLVQLSMAHLLQDVKYLSEFTDPQVQHYGKNLLSGLRALFWTLHRKAELDPDSFESELARAHDRIWRTALPEFQAPVHRLIRNMATRFDKHGEAYFRIITDPGIDPTNNIAEQAMRFVVMDRHMTQGTRSLRGRESCERLWTVMATCVLHKRSAFHWNCRAIGAYFKGEPAPSLIPDSS